MTIQDRLFDWVDEASDRNDRRFNPQRVTRLFCAYMFASILQSLPIALLGLLFFSWNKQAERNAEEHRLRDSWQATEKAAHEGKTGEAFRALFGVTQVPEALDARRMRTIEDYSELPVVED